MLSLHRIHPLVLVLIRESNSLSNKVFRSRFVSASMISSLSRAARFNVNDGLFTALLVPPADVVLHSASPFQ